MGYGSHIEGRVAKPERRWGLRPRYTRLAPEPAARVVRWYCNIPSKFGQKFGTFWCQRLWLRPNFIALLCRPSSKFQEGNRISPLESHWQPLEQVGCFPGVFSGCCHLSAQLLHQFHCLVVPGPGCTELKGHCFVCFSFWLRVLLSCISYSAFESTFRVQ